MSEPVDDLIGGDEPNPFGSRLLTQKRGPGRPPKFETVEQLEAKIEEYFTVYIAPKQLKDHWGDPMWAGIPILHSEDDGPEKAGKPLLDERGRHIYTPESKRPIMSEPLPPTVADLALFLGFSDYRAIYMNNYANDPDMNAAIKKAIGQIAAYAQRQLLSGVKTPTGAIFWLKNHGWRDTVQQEVYGKDGGPIETKDSTPRDASILQHFIDNHKGRVK